MTTYFSVWGVPSTEPKLAVLHWPQHGIYLLLPLMYLRPTWSFVVCRSPIAMKVTHNRLSILFDTIAVVSFLTSFTVRYLGRYLWWVIRFKALPQDWLEKMFGVKLATNLMLFLWCARTKVVGCWGSNPQYSSRINAFISFATLPFAVCYTSEIMQWFWRKCQR